MIIAVTQCGSALEYASEYLKADKEVVTVAVAENGYALEYASEDLKAKKFRPEQWLHDTFFFLSH